jgi:NADPH:quinone reductase-like Zn-dependent oxidoreductase
MAAPHRRWEAAQFGGPEGLACVEFAPPALGAREVLVRVQATTATYTDLLVLRGNYRPQFPPPVCPGYDCVGTVAAVGAGVTSLQEGDTVAAMPQHGCCATCVVLPAALCIKLDAAAAPPPDKAVAVVLTGVTAHQMLHRAAGDRLKQPGAAVLIHGAAGGTGAMLVQLAKLAGVAPDRIFGTCSDRNLPAVAALGVTALSYSAAGEQSWERRVMAATNGQGVDVVCDAVVLNGYLGKGLACLKRGGKFIAYGFTNSEAPGAFNIAPLLGAMARMTWQQKVVSWFDGKEAEFYMVSERRDKQPGEFADDLRLLLGQVAEGKLQPVIEKVWPFDQAPQALQAIAEGKHRGKQIVRMP